MDEFPHIRWVLPAFHIDKNGSRVYSSLLHANAYRESLLPTSSELERHPTMYSIILCFPGLSWAAKARHRLELWWNNGASKEKYTPWRHYKSSGVYFGGCWITLECLEYPGYTWSQGKGAHTDMRHMRYQIKRTRDYFDSCPQPVYHIYAKDVLIKTT